MNAISRKLLGSLTLAAAVAAAPLAAAGAPAAPSAPAPSASTSGASESLPRFDVRAIDSNVSPCDDFFRYACGGWLATHEIPPDQSVWGRFSELHERDLESLHAILEKDAVDSPARTPIQRQVGDFYAACMDEKGIEAKGLSPLAPELARIDGLTAKSGLADVVAGLHRVGVEVLFRFSSRQNPHDATANIAAADQAGLALPDREYYLKTDAKSTALRDRYRRHVARMLELFGEPAARAEADATSVLAFETELAKISLDRVVRRDPRKTDHDMSLKDFQALTPGFAWDRFLAGMDAPPVQRLNVAVPDYFRELDASLARADLATLRAYLRFHLLHAEAELLPAAFVQENFELFNRALSGSPEIQARWKRCTTLTDRLLGEALGQEFVAEHFSEADRERTRAMVQAIEAALGDDIRTLPWMSPATRAAAETKLKAVANKVGYPDHWRDYSSVRVDRGDALGDVLRARAFDQARRLNKIGHPIDRGEWTMTPPTVNANYNPPMNDVNFPAGILQPPFFDPSLDDAVNFGGIGVVIGHELTHGFDDSGRRFAGNGNLEDWWTPADTKEFESRATCVADQYSSYTAVDDMKVNGRLTLGENTADNGGLRVAYMALEKELAGKPQGKIDGFTPEQRFFLGFAQVWCEKERPEALRRSVLTNPHSPGRYRVIGTLSNSPEFQKAWSCPAGSPMAPVERCRVW
jgi:putative endopeptidase